MVAFLGFLKRNCAGLRGMDTVEGEDWPDRVVSKQ